MSGITHAAVWAACCSFISHNTDVELRPSMQGFLQVNTQSQHLCVVQMFLLGLQNCIMFLFRAYIMDLGDSVVPCLVGC